MFSLGSELSYIFYREACDIRKGFDGLSALVTHELGRNSTFSPKPTKPLSEPQSVIYTFMAIGKPMTYPPYE